MEPELKWQEPPPAKRHGGGQVEKWRPIFDALRAMPGRWALVAENAHASTAANISSGKLKGAERGEFEAACRKTEGGKYDIYARFVGDAR